MTLKEIENNYPEIPIGKVENLVDKHFGLLTVLYRTENKSKKVRWVCKCECGNYTVSQSYNLKNGHTNSCGCYRNKKTSETHLIDLSGQRFGKLTVLNRCAERIIQPSGQIKTKYHCRCDCSREIEVSLSNLKGQHPVTSCGCNKSLGENKVAEILTKNNIDFEQEKTFESCRFSDTNALARFDFYLPKYNLLIEYDGIQHYGFREGTGWNNKENYLKTKEHDEYKNNWCKENNIKLIRISYTEYNYLSLEKILGEEN